MATLLILGEHDKGLGEPFSPTTVSGRRLRGMVADLQLDADFGNVFEFVDGRCVERDLSVVCRPYRIVAVVGQVAQTECNRQGIVHEALPHPAVRSARQLAQLRDGLAAIQKDVRMKRLPLLDDPLIIRRVRFHELPAPTQADIIAIIGAAMNDEATKTSGGLVLSNSPYIFGVHLIDARSAIIDGHPGWGVPLDDIEEAFLAARGRRPCLRQVGFPAAGLRRVLLWQTNALADEYSE